MPKKKDLSIYFLHLIKEKGTSDTKGYQSSLLKEEELIQIINDIKTLTLNSSEAVNRYSDEDDPKCIIFADDDIIKNNPHFFIPKMKNLITGAFFKKRNTDFPYQSDDETIQKLDLPEGSAIIETTYFIIDPNHQILVWLGNKATSGYNGFAKYLTQKYVKLCKHEKRLKPIDATNNKKEKEKNDFSPLEIENKPAHIGASLILNPDALKEFEERMNSISEFEIKISGTMVEMDRLYGKDKKIEEALKQAISIGDGLGSKSIYIKVSQDKEKSLNKSKIKKIVESLKNIKEKEKVIVRGIIDDETRYIDLIEEHFSYKTTIEIEDRYIDQRKIFDAMKKGYDSYLTKIIDNINNV